MTSVHHIPLFGPNSSVSKVSFFNCCYTSTNDVEVGFFNGGYNFRGECRYDSKNFMEDMHGLDVHITHCCAHFFNGPIWDDQGPKI